MALIGVLYFTYYVKNHSKGEQNKFWIISQINVSNEYTDHHANKVFEGFARSA